MLTVTRPRTLSELQADGYAPRSVRTEMEQNLARKLRAGEPLFPGIIGYDDTVVPQLVNAVLAHHDIVLLGERGQAKSRIMRSLVSLLDEAIPVVAGCEINDDPLHPICLRCRRLKEEKQGALPLEWLPRERRYGERLAPGTRIADLIGDLDPARVAAGSPLASEDALHFGLIPRMNRGIFALNELPDLEYLVQVALFNILEERDVQIRGYPIRFDLDVVLVFTANPEEYSRSGKIITQLKDRIGAEIRTHYPMTRELGMAIVRQEARQYQTEPPVEVPDFMLKVVEQMTMEARRSPYVNHKAGVSARLSITNYETMLANSRRRALLLKEPVAVPRMTDLNYLYASSLGKIELDPFREETVTEAQVVTRIFEKAIKTVFEEYIRIDEQEQIAKDLRGEATIEVSDMMPSNAYQALIPRLPGLFDAVHTLGGEKSEWLRASCIEFVLEGLCAAGKLSRSKIGELVAYRQRGS